VLELTHQQLIGNNSKPNAFSNNLLNNIGLLTGAKPYIRVGGNTQDYALYNGSLKEATNGTYDLSRSSDYPTTLSIGPLFFKSYGTFPDTKFIHGFNLALGGNSSEGLTNLLETVPIACKALSDGKLFAWEFGNEPDLYVTSGSSPVRPRTWHEPQYVAQWLNGTRAIKSAIAAACPNLALNNTFNWIAPSFAGTHDWLAPLTTWEDGLDTDGDIEQYSHHKYDHHLPALMNTSDKYSYIGGATAPGVTLQGTLMNHSSNVHSLINPVKLLISLQNFTNIPFIFGETNSLYNEGAPGLSNSFGAALWGIDYNLYSASVGVRRVHMHQGTDYRYASWQPIHTNKTSIGTKPPYYGNIAVAAMMGDLTRHQVQIANIPMTSELESAYAAYVDGALDRITVINRREYNYTLDGAGAVLNPAARPSQLYTFSVSAECSPEVGVQRLIANGSDAVSGISWDGVSYNWELDMGKPMRLYNVTIGETAKVINGVVSVSVKDSEAVILNFLWRL
jgi:hypothetical protein